MTGSYKLNYAISRRAAVRAGLGAMTLSWSGMLLTQQATEVFRHGVASGDPDHRSVVLWSRVEPTPAAAIVTWEVAADPAFKHIVKIGEVSTDQHRDYTVKVLVDGLAPGKTYYYRFHANHQTSPTGRTRTLPVGKLDRLGLALASCSNYAFGFFNAYEVIANDSEVDFVLHLGDYIYEYGADGWGADVASRLGRVHFPAHETVTLQDYRQRHAQYKADPQSQAMHAAHPLLAVWDDHESANNPWQGGAQNHQPSSEGSWLDRKQASLRAYYEWMPIRELGPGGNREAYWRTYQFGDLATLVTLETRHTARAKQIDYADHIHAIQSVAQARRFEREVLGAPGRRMLSEQMERALHTSLKASINAGQPWRLIGNAIPMARTPVPDVSKVLGTHSVNGTQVPGVQADLVWKGRFNLPFYLDSWDGYPWAREQFYRLCQSAGADDLIVLTGDSHSFWANRLFDARGAPMGVELGTAGITSPGDFIESGYDPSTAAKLDNLFAEAIPEILWTDNMHQGYVRLVLRNSQARVGYVAVNTVLQKDFSHQEVRSETIVHRNGSVGYLK